MNNLKKLSYILLVMSMAQAAFGQDDFFEPSFYLGAGIGISDYNDMVLCSDCGDLRDAFDEVDEHGFSTSVFGGYRFNKYLAAEMGIFDLGTGNFDVIDDDSGNFEGGLKTETRGIRIAAKGMLPVSNRFTLFAKLGAQYHDVDATVSTIGINGIPPASNKVSWNSTKLYYAGGIDFNLTSSWSISAAYETYVGDTGDFDNASLEEDDAIDSYRFDLRNVTLAVAYRF